MVLTPAPQGLFTVDSGPEVLSCLTLSPSHGLGLQLGQLTSLTIHLLFENLVKFGPRSGQKLGKRQ